ncbi:MAG: amidohydrolase family protein [Planctomycetota bacterium]
MHWSQAYLDDILLSFGENGVKAGVNLWWPDYHDYAGFLRICRKRGLFERFAQFCRPDWRLFGWQGTKFVKKLCADMPKFAKLGATGLKVWKDIGMFNFHADGTPVVMDDEQLEPVWRMAAELGWRIAVHQADPSKSYTQRARTKIPREEIFKRRDAVISRHPEIKFTLCHSGNDIEDYDKFAAHLDRFPNVNADLRWPANFTSAPGREKAFLEKYSHRLYLGPDMVMSVERPPDRKWNNEQCYGPLRRNFTACGLSAEAFTNITWKNGTRDFLKKT